MQRQEQKANCRTAPNRPAANRPAPGRPAPGRPPPNRPTPNGPAPTQPKSTQPAPDQPAATQPAPHQPALPVSVIIPTLNASGPLAATCSALVAVTQIVVADGGSTDATPDLARLLGCTVVTAPRGRGCQLAAGVAASNGGWLLLLHADTRLQPGWAEAVATHMRQAPHRAGYFRFALDSTDRRARRLERAVRWRCRLLALPYGDQGLLIQRALLDTVGGIRPIPLMEDVDLVRRLGRHRLAALDAVALTSAAKWQRDGWLRRSARNLACLALWFGGVSPDRLVRLYR